MAKKSPENELVVSYFTLRAIIGAIGMLLPFVLWLGALVFFGTRIQSSVSSYYHTGMREVFTGVLWATGVFLFAYNCYGLLDKIAGKLACLFAIGVTLFPTAPDGATDPVVLLKSDIHLTFAALFFLTLAFFSLVLFTKTSKKNPTPQKRARNIIYYVCGSLMLLCIAIMAVFAFLPDALTAPYDHLHPIFWLEALAIFAFGVSWFVKGEMILKDLPKQ